MEKWKIGVHADDMTYACEAQQAHRDSNGSTVANTSKDFHGNSYAEKGMLSLQFKSARDAMLCLLFCLWWLSVQETLASVPRTMQQESPLLQLSERPFLL